MLILDDKGLIPAVIQDASTLQVLMLAYVTPGSLKRTLDGGDVWFYSRSRAELWHKGEVSGNYLHVRSVRQDCDGDALLIQVTPEGPACHTGNQSCFFTAVAELPPFQQAEPGPGILEELFSVIQDRRDADPQQSYTARLLQEGPRRIAQKVIEEAGEAALAGSAGQKEELAQEAADLLYHALVLLAASGVKPADVWQVLRERRKG